MKSTVAILAFVAMAATACAGAPTGGAMHASAGPDIMVVPGPGVSGTMTGTVAVVSTDASTSEQQVCRKLEAKTGSRVGTRDVCMTQAQWDSVEKAAKDFTKDVQDSGKWNMQSGQ